MSFGTGGVKSLITKSLNRVFSGLKVAAVYVIQQKINSNLQDRWRFMMDNREVIEQTLQNYELANEAMLDSFRF